MKKLELLIKHVNKVGLFLFLKLLKSLKITTIFNKHIIIYKKK